MNKIKKLIVLLITSMMFVILLSFVSINYKSNNIDSLDGLNLIEEKNIKNVLTIKKNTSSDENTLGEEKAYISIRLGDSAGFRFKYILTKEMLSSAFNDNNVDFDNYSFGVIIAKTASLNEATLVSKLNDTSINKLKIEANNKYVSNNKITFAAVLVGFDNEDKYNADFTAVAYVSNGVNTCYSAESSYSYMKAVNYYLDSNNSIYSKLTDTQINELKTIKENYSYKITVNHYKQNINDDEYTLYESEIIKANSGESISADVKEYAGFSSPETQTIVVKNNDTINYYYQRNAYTLTVIRNDGTTKDYTLKSGANILDNIEITRDNYTFGGLYSDASLNNSLVIMPSTSCVSYVWWKEETKTNNFTYSGNDNISIDSYIGTDKEVVIPEYIGNIKVTTINNQAFYQKNVTSVKLPSSITTIKENAFKESSVANINLPEGLTSIESGAFKSCTSLSNVVLPSTLTSIGSSLFYSCSALETLTINCNINYSSSNGFYYDCLSLCKNLKTVIIGEGVSSIGADAFKSDSIIENISLPNSLETIGERAFYACTNLKSLTLPQNIKSIGNLAFYQCTSLNEVEFDFNIASSSSSNAFFTKCFPACSNLTKIIFGENVTSIGDFAFYEASQIRNVEFNNNLETIGNSAFYNCTNLTTISLPSSLKKIGTYAFYNLSNLTDVTFNDKLESIDSYAFSRCTHLTNINIPDSVISIGSFAFSNCSELTDVSLGKGIESVESYAFSECSLLKNLEINFNIKSATSSTDAFSYTTFLSCFSLENVTFNEGVTSIGDFAFDSFSYLKNISLPETLTTLGQSAFYKTNITSLKLPSSIISIGDYAFSNCTSLKDLEIDFNVTNNFYENYFALCKSLENVVVGENVTSIGDNAFSECSSIKNISLSDSLLSIGNAAFENCNIENISLPDNITSIGDYAFSGTSLTSLTLPLKLKTIGKYAFEGLSQINELIINDEVETIGDYAFLGCSGIQTLVLGKNLKNIYTGSFANCSKISKIVINGNLSVSSFYKDYLSSATSLNTVIYGDDVTSVSDYAFDNCSSLTSLTLGKSITTFGYNPFRNCLNITSLFIDFNIPDVEKETKGFYQNYLSSATNLTNVTFYDNVTSIGDYAFASCTSISNIKLPTTLKVVGAYAFKDCTSLNNISLPDNLTEIKEGAFSNCSSLSNIDIPSLITKINASTFASCTSLTSFNTNDNIEIIASNAFLNCSSLKNLTLGKGISSIDATAFSGCSNLENLFVDFDILSATDSTDGFYNKYFISSLSLKNVTFNDNVTSIGDYAFNSCTSLENVTFSDNITNIGDFAFSNCSSLTNIDILDNITTLGNGVFANDTSLKSISIGEGISKISANLFEGCCALNEAYIPNNITTIADEAFKDCNSITSLIFGNGISLISENAFSGCSAINDLVINFNIAESDNGFYETYFKDATNIKNLTLGNNVTFLGSDAFYNLKSLENVYYQGVLDDWMQIVFNNDFSNPTYYSTKLYLLDTNGNITYNNQKYALLQEVIIPSNICQIKNFTFYNLKDITTVLIPNTITSIGRKAFHGCTNLKELYYQDDIEKWMNIDFDTNFVTSHPTYYSGKIYLLDDNGTLEFDGKKYSMLTKLVLSENVTTIKKYMFYNFSTLESVTMSNSLTTIEYGAFNWCIHLKEVNFGENVTEISDDAFRNCYSLTSIVIPNKVTELNNGIFYNCYNLVSVTIPASVTTIHSTPFEYCYSLVEVVNLSNISIAKGSNQTGSAGLYALNIKTSGESDIVNIDGYLFYTYDEVNYLLKYVGDDKNLTLPTSYNGENYEIYKYAFYYQDNIESVILPDFIEKIDVYTFANCSSLKEITIPDKVTSIENYAFSNCTNLEKVVLGQNLANIATKAFEKCSNLETLEINSNIASTSTNKEFYKLYFSSSSIKYLILNDTATIGSYAFASCDSLISITINGVKEIKENAFASCNNLKTLIFNSAYQTINANAFVNCININDLVINFNIPTATSAENGFYNSLLSSSTNIQNIIIGENVTSIGAYAFESCTSISNVYYNNALNKWVEIKFENEYSNPVYYAKQLCIRSEFYRDYIYDGKTYYLVTEIRKDDVISKINDYAFINNQKLTNVTTNDITISIGKYAFSNCTSLNSLSLGENIHLSDSTCFEGCINLELLEICGNIDTASSLDTCFYNNYFKDATNLTTLIIGPKVNFIGAYAFASCTSLNNVFYQGTPSSWSQITFENEYSNPIYFAKILYCLDSNGSIIYGNNAYSLVSSATITGISTIKSYAFYDLESLEEVIIGDDITVIGSYAFYNCNALKNIFIGKNVTSLDKTTFGLVSNLSDLEIHANIISDANNEGFFKIYFSNVTEIENLTIGKEINILGALTFDNLNFIENVYYQGSMTDWSQIEFKDVNANPFSKTNNFYYLVSKDGDIIYKENNYKLLTELILENTINTINAYAFVSSKQITSVYIPSSITTIETSAFLKCNNLTTIYYEGSMDDWLAINFANADARPNKNNNFTSFYILDASGTISYNNNLYSVVTSIVIPSSITAIGTYTFANFANLENVTFHQAILTIGTYAFYNCKALTNVNLENSNTMSIDTYAFAFCSNLKDVKLPNTLRILGSYAFTSCSSLESIILPDSVTPLYDNVFKGCSNLKSVVIPQNLKYIYNDSFTSCNNLTAIYYSGSYEKFITIDGYDYLNQDIIYYYSDTTPEDTTHNYWHYVDNIITIW